MAAPESQGGTDSGIPTAGQGQEAACVGEDNPYHPGCCSYCSWLFGFSGQCNE